MSLHVPRPARVVDRVNEATGIFTLRLEYTEADAQRDFEFEPGQFNMLYLHGVGEVPISIISDPRDSHFILHTVRAVGRVTRGLAGLRVGDEVGLRGPFGRGWPLRAAENKDLVIVTGGLGCAPVVSVINYIFRRRQRFGRVFILQGVRHSNDLIWRERYAAWQRDPGTTVLLAADVTTPGDTLFRGTVVDLFERVDASLEGSVAMLCGPEVMMLAAVAELRTRGLEDRDIWLSLERNMHCGSGHCGHCQFGPRFVCHGGPVFSYDEIADWFGVKGF